MPQTATDILIAGTGVLSRDLCLALGQTNGPPLRVAVLGRSRTAVEQLCFLASAVACARQTGSMFLPVVADLASTDSLESAVAGMQPKIAVSCVSYHSPWESMHSASAWTELVRAAGFGVTLPLQWTLAARILKAVTKVSPATVLLNACFPDVLNVLLHVAGVRVLCGIGNIATLATAIHAQLRPMSDEELRVLAHHRHLHAVESAADEAQIWLRGKQLPNAGELLQRARQIPRQQLCLLAGGAAATLLRNILVGQECSTHVPGPMGLPGGYPVRVRQQSVELDLPPGMSRAEAIAWNERAAWNDGVSVSSAGDVTFAESAAQALRAHSCEVAAGFRLDQIEQACEIMLALRDRLRTVERATEYKEVGGA
jgi:hypothetical protein